MARSDQCNQKIMTQDLGNTYDVSETECKVQPSIAWNHPPQVALKKMMQTNVCGLVPSQKR